MWLLREHSEIVRSELISHDGREVKHTGDGVMAAFTSIVGAIAYAVAVQRRIHARNENAETPFELSIGDIAVSLGIRELCVGKAFHFDDLGNFNLKGLPTPAYGECGREVAS